MDHDFDGWTPAEGDCDDEEPDTNPGMEELWYDGVDRDCDGWDDDDADYDGHAWDGVGGDDCDDSRDDVSPSDDEICNGIDDNCDGDTDEDSAIDAKTWYADVDGDGYGKAGEATTTCTQPTGTVRIPGDCDDDEPLANPGEVEVCNDGLDNDCDGSANGCGMTGDEELSDAAVAYYGGSSSDYLGLTMVTGDWDGDGVLDLLAGAYGAGRGGEAYAVHGPLTAGGALDSLGTTIAPGSVPDRFAWEVANAGDLDGDGADELVVSDYLDDQAASNAGRIYLYSGADVPTSGSLATPLGSLTGTGSNDYAGYALEGVGDADGDGIADLLVGVPNADGDSAGAGRAVLVTSTPSGRESLQDHSWALMGDGAGDDAGYAVAGAGDVDGDGVSDLLVGAPYADPKGSSSGTAYLVLGPGGEEMSLVDADAVLTGGASYDYVGDSLDSAGDQDGDGLPDLIVGAHGADDGGSSSGTSYVVSGLTTGTRNITNIGHKLIGDSSGDYSGLDVAGLGDVDGDGWDDVMVGAYAADNNGGSSGTAFIVLGPVSGTVDLGSADGAWHGEKSSDSAGREIEAAGDVDGDGFHDALIGAYGHDTGGSSAGAVYLLKGGEI